MKLIERDPLLDRFEERLRELDVQAVLFDLDDTLIFTSEIFLQKMRAYVEAVVSGGELDEETFYSELSRINDEEYLTL